MHVAVFADIEGSFGIWRRRQCHTGTAEWQYGRGCLTADVNAAVAGAFDGGARRVTVKDTHDTGFNIIVPQLDRRARYLGGHFVRPTFFGDVSGYDLILYVAIHAAAGTPDAFFPHTHYGIFSALTVNGQPACELDIYGGYLGELGLPIGLISGEDIAVEQALRALPWAKSVTVDKRQQAYVSGDKSRRYLADGRRRLREQAARAVRDAGQMKPLIWPGPLHFEAQFRNGELADRFNTWGLERSGTTVRWQARTMTDGFDELNKLTFFSRRIYPVRRPLTYLRRQLYRIRSRYFAPAPNAENAAVLHR